MEREDQLIRLPKEVISVILSNVKPYKLSGICSSSKFMNMVCEGYIKDLIHTSFPLLEPLPEQSYMDLLNLIYGTENEDISARSIILIDFGKIMEVSLVCKLTSQGYVLSISDCELEQRIEEPIYEVLLPATPDSSFLILAKHETSKYGKIYLASYDLEYEVDVIDYGETSVSTYCHSMIVERVELEAKVLRLASYPSDTGEDYIEGYIDHEFKFHSLEVDNPLTVDDIVYSSEDITIVISPEGSGEILIEDVTYGTILPFDREKFKGFEVQGPRVYIWSDNEMYYHDLEGDFLDQWNVLDLVYMCERIPYIRSVKVDYGKVRILDYNGRVFLISMSDEQRELQLILKNVNYL